MASVEDRAVQSAGTSGSPIYHLVARILASRMDNCGVLLDVGGGTGSLWPYVRDRVQKYIVADVIRHEGIDSGHEFVQANLDSERIPIPDRSVDVVVASEVIEHVENPRSLFRELGRLVRPGGLVIITTPNQLSILSKLTLILKNHFNAFGPGSYPAHITALLEIDLLRIAEECGLVDPKVAYTNRGRIPGTSWHWPSWFGGRAFSDNVAVSALAPR